MLFYSLVVIRPLIVTDCKGVIIREDASRKDTNCFEKAVTKKGEIDAVRFKMITFFFAFLCIMFDVLVCENALVNVFCSLF
jgi:hypothetical protein